MSEDLNTSSRKLKRVTRTQRNRPVLVTSLATEQQEQLLEEMTTATVEPITLVDTPPTPRGRIAGFFSTVGKSDEATKTNDAEIAKARLARATYGKSAAGKTALQETPEAEKNAVKPVAAKAGTAMRPGQTQKPQSLLRPRYLLGMAIYLVAANYLGGVERNLLVSLHIEKTLAQFNLFGFPVGVTPSGITFIITLVIILVLLVRFDLLPTSLGGASSAQARKRSAAASKSTSNREISGDGPKLLPPVIKPGVQGADDKLYRAYRSNQRRDKKR